jgi:hypothetical protein
MVLLRQRQQGAAPKPQKAVHGHRWIDYREFQETNLGTQLARSAV